MKMETIVGSSNVARVGYDPDAKVLRVEFHSGSTYDYYEVTFAENVEFRGAPSAGQHLNRHIKPGRTYALVM